ncbi:Isochorismatase domain-containing protein 1 [Clydaea vesicula]|uniref:Isochorismatase domain-containing protein 1 n=1 Tax=Clydaea vesicula TaxID=447962 RepID=A0AAD5U628_9FUNG|nr:Isochorismatase domain-containing protein 1 [Clydaea vesicula]
MRFFLALGSTCSELDVSSASLVCPKTKFSMWIKEVDQVLSKESKPKTIVLFGIESHVCVLQTCLDLLEQDFNVVVLVDGVSSMNKGEIGIALERMKSSGAILASSESILFQLVADASNPSFKAISNLVKSTKDSTASVFESLVSQSKI